MGKGIAILFLFTTVISDRNTTSDLDFNIHKVEKLTAFIVLLAVWGLFISVTGLFLIAKPYFKPMILTQKDIIGNYVIDKDKSAGKQELSAIHKDILKNHENIQTAFYYNAFY